MFDRIIISHPVSLFETGYSVLAKRWVFATRGGWFNPRWGQFFFALFPPEFPRGNPNPVKNADAFNFLSCYTISETLCTFKTTKNFI
jgi:hypothetical protein